MYFDNRIHLIQELIKDFRRRWIVELHPGQIIHFISKPHNLFISIILNRDSLRNISAKQSIVALVLSSLPRWIRMSKVNLNTHSSMLLRTSNSLPLSAVMVLNTLENLYSPYSFLSTYIAVFTETESLTGIFMAM